MLNRKLHDCATFTLSAIRDLEECINLSPEVIQNTGGNVTRLRNALSEAGAAIREELDTPFATRKQLHNSALYVRAYRQKVVWLSLRFHIQEIVSYSVE